MTTYPNHSANSTESRRFNSEQSFAGVGHWATEKLILMVVENRVSEIQL